MEKLLPYLLSVSFVFSHLTIAEAQDSWPQWRGPNRDSMTSGEDWPDNLRDETLKETWNVELGPSYSGPIVVGDNVFTTETVEEKEERVLALDRKTGKQVWEHRWEGAMKVPFFARSNGSWIRSTPAYDDGHLYVAGIRDVLVCLKADTGQEVWRTDFAKELGTSLPSFGFVCSPLVDGDHVYVQAGASLACLNKKTGKVLWRSLKDEGGMSGSAFSSPVMASLAGKRQLVVLMRESMSGVDPVDGNELWNQEIKAFRGMNILTPSISGNQILTAAYGGRTHLFEVAGKDSDLGIREVWNYKTQGYMSSPVWLGDHAYIHLRNQRVMCINTKTGEEAWMTRKSFGKYMSMISNGKFILALDQKGRLWLLRANPEKYDLLDERELGEDETWAHLAKSGQQLFVRKLNSLTAYDWKPAKE
jgi:outer membrane protein assembly factor BamB